MFCNGRCRYPSLNDLQSKDLEARNLDNWQNTETRYNYEVVNFA